MRCHRCTTRLEQRARFCDACGTPVAAPATQRFPPAAPTIPLPPPPSTDREVTWFAFTAVLVGIFCLLLLLGAALVPPKPRTLRVPSAPPPSRRIDRHLLTLRGLLAEADASTMASAAFAKQVQRQLRAVTHDLIKLDTHTHPTPPAVTTCLTSMNRIRAALFTHDLHN